MNYTRRDVGKMTLAGLTLAKAFGAKMIDSKFSGVQVGAITYSFNRIAAPDPEAIIKAYAEIGLGEAELMSNHCESLAGAPAMPIFGRGPGGGGGGRGQQPPAGGPPSGAAAAGGPPAGASAAGGPPAGGPPGAQGGERRGGGGRFQLT